MFSNAIISLFIPFNRAFYLLHLPISAHSLLILRSQSLLFVMDFNVKLFIKLRGFPLINIHFLRYSGWHICSTCQKASHYMCYTCTYSLCKGCTKDADFVFVRENKGLCGICMRTIMLIENSAQGNKEKVCWTFLSMPMHSVQFSPSSLLSFSLSLLWVSGEGVIWCWVKL